MLELALRGLTMTRAGRRLTMTRALAVVLVLAGCAPLPEPLEGPGDPLEAARAYVDDAWTRRRALEASVAVADTPYATTRLAHYALGGAGIDDPAADWDTLPVFEPRVRRLLVRGAPEIDRDEGPITELGDAFALADLAALERAGAAAFERYPAQLDLALDPLRDRATAEAAGLVVTEEGVVRGAVEVETAAGWMVALSCAACHAAERDGALLMGVPNERLDLGLLLGGRWPRGTIDVTDDGIESPVRPSDLRPIAMQSRLHHAGNLANGRIARMVRIETLLIGQRNARARPDRPIVAALAMYLESLGRALPELDWSGEGARAFESACAGCHRGPELAGPPVSIALVGTDASATRPGSERATGGYRAPSLLGAADRRGVLHDGSAESLDAILGLTPSDHAGHAFGLDLDERSRRAIAAFLRGTR